MDPSSLEPSPQRLPPTVVAFLLQGGKVTEEVFSRCLLALADDGWLRIEPQDAGPPVVRIVRQPELFQVRRSERLAVERVRQRMGTMPHVPLSALTSREDEDFEPWWTKFGEAVKKEAVDAGLLTGGSSVVAGCVIPFGLAAATTIATTIATIAAGMGPVAGDLGAGVAAFVVAPSSGPWSPVRS